MLLRASGERDGKAYNTNSVTDDSSDSGVLHSDWLRALTEAAIRSDFGALGKIREDAARVMGEQQMVDTLTVAAAFNGITRVADATGIPLDESTAEGTVALRVETGIAAFDYHEKTARYSAA